MCDTSKTDMLHAAKFNSLTVTRMDGLPHLLLHFSKLKQWSAEAKITLVLEQENGPHFL